MKSQTNKNFTNTIAASTYLPDVPVINRKTLELAFLNPHDTEVNWQDYIIISDLIVSEGEMNE